MVLGNHALKGRGVALLVGIVSFVPLVLASPDEGRILSFESLSDWTMSEGVGTVSLDNSSSTGNHSITLSGSGFRRMAGANVTTLGSGDTSVIKSTFGSMLA